MVHIGSAISLRQLHYLVAVADAGSFSAAAAQTHVAQPALSRQIAMLEVQVGLRLLDRSRKGVTLTEGGARRYTLARSMLERLDNIQTELRASENRPRASSTLRCHPAWRRCSCRGWCVNSNRAIRTSSCASKMA